MDVTAIVVILILLVFAWLQLSAYSFCFNICASFLVLWVSLYFLITSSVLLPFEQILFLFYKGRTKAGALSSEVSTRNIDFDDEITRKLRELIGHIVRDFILDWYNTVSDDVHFVQESFELFEHLFHCLRTRVSAVDPEVLLHNLLCFLSRHLTCYQQSVQYARKTSPNDLERRQQLVIITYEKRLGHLAMSNYPDTETDHLRSLTAVLLKALLPREYRLTGASLYVVRELISKNVFLPFIDILTDPNWINRNIVLILRDKDPLDDKQSNDSSEEGSETSSDSNEVVEKNLDSELESPPVIIPQETIPSFPITKKPRKVLKVAFSVLNNTNELDLDLDYLDSTGGSTTSENLADVFSEALFTSTKNTSEIDSKRFCEKPLASGDFHVDSVGSSHVGNDVTILQTLPENITAIPSDARTESIENSSQSNADEKPSKRTGATDIPGSDVGNRLDLHDDRFFKRIRIPRAMTIEEPFEGGSKYTLYVVEYCAPSSRQGGQTPFQKQDNSSSREVDEEILDPVPTQDNLQHYQVKRRFREFLTLQGRLNEKVVMRRIVRNVKAPSRMFPMPIGNMDRDYIEKRRRFLQAYLRELCNFPHINKSAEMKEFLSYNADPRIAFVRRPSHYIPRFDKLLKNVVKDIFGAATHKITDKFAPIEEESVLMPSGYVEEPFKEQGKPLFLTQTLASSSSTALNEIVNPHGFSTPKSKQNPVTMLKNIVLGRTTDMAIFEEGMREYSAFTGPANANRMRFGRRWRTPEHLLANRTSYHVAVMQRRSQGDGCDQSDELEGQVNSHKDLVTGPIFRLVHQIWGVCVGTNTMLFSSLGGFVKKYIDIRVSLLTSKDQWLFYLKTLQHALWPGGVWGGSKVEETKLNKEELYEEAQLILEETFPDVLRFLVGKQRYSHGVSELLDSLQDPVINRHVAYHLIDIFVKLIFPDLPTVISQATNISL